MVLEVEHAERLAELNLLAAGGWCAAALSMLVLAIFVLRPPFRRRSAPLLSRIRSLHGGESAIASMEYLLVLFPFLIIVMTVWQLAFMINAQMHVAYASYAAARSASVMIPADLESEEEGLLKKEGESGAQKWRRIKRAALPGTIAISPGNFGEAAGVALASGIRRGGVSQLGGLPDATAIGSRLTLMTVHHTKQRITEGTRFRRALVKNLYAEKMTEVLVNGNGSDELQNLQGADTVSATVNYVFWLHVPYVGRLLEAMFEGFKNPLTGEYVLLNPYPSMVLSETMTMTAWPRKRAIDPCPK